MLSWGIPHFQLDGFTFLPKFTSSSRIFHRDSRVGVCLFDSTAARLLAVRVRGIRREKTFGETSEQSKPERSSTINE